MDILQITGDLAEIFDSSELCKIQARQMAFLHKRLSGKDLTVAVIGQFKRGKTTFVNRILGKDVLPSGIVPITAAVTRISYGNDNVCVVFENGLRRNIDIQDISSFISEQENRDNVLGVKEVQLSLENDMLKNGLVLVDTPGVGSVHEKNSVAAYNFVKESDAVIFMLSVDSPINSIELDFLANVRNYAGKLYFCVNKIDMISEEELSAYMGYCENLLSEIMEDEAVRLFPVSAGTGKGIDEFVDSLSSEMKSKSRMIINESARLKTLEILNNTCDQIRSYRAVLNMAPNVFRSRFEKMNEILAEMKEKDAALDERIMLPAEYVNETKISLCGKVRELFGIEYYCDLQSVEHDELITAKEYAGRISEIYDELSETLYSIFMYKEENAYAVARRIEDLNILIKNIEKYRKLAANQS